MTISSRLITAPTVVPIAWSKIDYSALLAWSASQELVDVDHAKSAE
jgi:hypothetical protein